MAGRLTDKVFLVTDGSLGIEKVSAMAFIREGTEVIVANINVTGGKQR